MAGNLTKRILFAVVAIPAAAGVIWLGGWWLIAAIAVLGVLGAREVYDLARLAGTVPLTGLGYLGAAATPLVVTKLGHPMLVFDPLLLLTVWLLALLAAAMTRGPAQRPLAAVGITCFGALYASLPLTFLVDIRHGIANGHAPREVAFVLVLLPLALTWICDTAAYMAGSQFGGPKMAPVLSPNKTWSGAVGGVAGALLAAALLSPLLNRLGTPLSLIELLGLGLVVGIVAQVGDVAESLLKREAGVKDSSNLIPGHGGVLDRLDSLYFVIPASAALYRVYGAM